MIFQEATISAGFPSPSEGAANYRLSLDDLVLVHPEATFFMKMKGGSMRQFGIADGDLLVVDRSREAKHGSVVVVVVHDEFLVRRLVWRMGSWFLESDEGLQTIDESTETLVWGVVTHAVHSV